MTICDSAKEGIKDTINIKITSICVGSGVQGSSGSCCGFVPVPSRGDHGVVNPGFPGTFASTVIKGPCTCQGQGAEVNMASTAPLGI